MNKVHRLMEMVVNVAAILSPAHARSLGIHLMNVMDDFPSDEFILQELSHAAIAIVSELGIAVMESEKNGYAVILGSEPISDAATLKYRDEMDELFHDIEYQQGMWFIPE